jgi:DNA-binding FrmR family transcriptional regulator
MAELPVPRARIVTRLKKVEGQIKGLERMVEDERDCMDIMVQLTAAKSALESVAGLVLRNYASVCATRQGTDVAAELSRAVSVWMGGRAARE